jgi:polyhydroxyalkanoate synthesis regulator phasin|tara:strand:- start:628 stop:828 length:201 start_codon:yes stop_codon:yes gene_type:complete
MSYFDSLFKERVKEVIKEMIKSGEIIIDNNEIFITDGFEEEDNVVFVSEFEIDKKNKKNDNGEDDI